MSEEKKELKEEELNKVAGGEGLVSGFGYEIGTKIVYPANGEYHFVIIADYMSKTLTEITYLIATACYTQTTGNTILVISNPHKTSTLTHSFLKEVNAKVLTEFPAAGEYDYSDFKTKYQLQ